MFGCFEVIRAVSKVMQQFAGFSAFSLKGRCDGGKLIKVAQFDTH